MLPGCPVVGQRDGARPARAAGLQAGPEAGGAGAAGPGRPGLLAGRERGSQAGLPCSVAVVAGVVG